MRRGDVLEVRGGRLQRRVAVGEAVLLFMPGGVIIKCPICGYSMEEWIEGEGTWVCTNLCCAHVIHEGVKPSAAE